ncbi:hypothetical protein [Mesorhizobium sp. M0768]|uniref:hypothetical protein n=1 Tax=Mesorhizobium sp. M0768 TaxID=2956996 RepID=UPI003338524F
MRPLCGDAALDHPPVGGQDLGDQGAALPGADEFEAPQAERVDAVSQDVERLV